MKKQDLTYNQNNTPFNNFNNQNQNDNNEKIMSNNN